jgi:hypothetical protein
MCRVGWRFGEYAGRNAVNADRLCVAGAAGGICRFAIHGRDALRRSSSRRRLAARTSKNRSRRFYVPTIHGLHPVGAIRTSLSMRCSNVRNCSRQFRVERPPAACLAVRWFSIAPLRVQTKKGHHEGDLFCLLARPRRETSNSFEADRVFNALAEWAHLL